MAQPYWLPALFRAIDSRDADAFAAHIAEDGAFVFGNAPPVQGRQAIRDAVAGFFGAIGGLRHTLEESWICDGAVLCHGRVTYTRHDGSELTVPFANVLRMQGSLIRDYLIYVDASALFAPAAV